MAKSISKPTLVKSIDNTLVGEIPFCTVEEKIDMRESEDVDVLTRIESIRDTEEHNGDGISVCVTHRYGDKHICFPKNIPNCKTHPPAFRALADVITEEEDIGPVEMVASEGENISDSTVDAYADEFSLEPILTDQHKQSRTIRRISLNIDT